jgi:predicted DNA-binding WGR domain protein
MILLTRSMPEQSMHRFYALHLAPTLFGEWTVVSEWGRIGSLGTVRRETFADEPAASAALENRLARKRRRGYVHRVSARNSGLPPVSLILRWCAVLL